MSFGKGGGDDGLPADSPFLGNAITRWFIDTGTYPNNCQQWWVYKRPVALSGQSHPRGYAEVFDTDMRNQFTEGNSPAPKAHYILNAFRLDRSEASGISGLPVRSSGGARPTACAFYAGRVWYAGVKSARFSTSVYFSQIIERDEQVGMCYQTSDPTDEDVPDLVPSDGGQIIIPEVAEVVALFAKGDHLFVFATNGIWTISGSETLGFRANDYSVAKLTDIPALSKLSLVSVDGNPLWWNRSGIYAIGPAQNGLGFTVQSLTDMTIKTFLDGIPDESKKFVKGAYNPQTKIVQWVYRSSAPQNIQECYEYDRILNLDTTTGAFYPWRVGGDLADVAIRGIFAVEGEAVRETDDDVVVGGDPVEADGDPVTVTLRTRLLVDSRFKYTTNIQGLESA